MTNEKIARINELARKSKTTGLTEAEGRAAGPSAGVCGRRQGQPAGPVEQHFHPGAGRHHPQDWEKELKMERRVCARICADPLFLPAESCYTILVLL